MIISVSYVYGKKFGVLRLKRIAAFVMGLPRE